MIGASVGVLVGGLTALETRTKQRQLAWRIEAGLGGGLVLVGVIALGVGLRGFNRTKTDATLDALLWEREYNVQVVEHGRRYALGAGLVGAGIGLGTTAVAGLLIQRLTSARGNMATRWKVHPQALALSF